MEVPPLSYQDSLVAHMSPEIDPTVQVLNRLIAKSLGSRDEFLTFADKAKATGVFAICMAIKQSRDDFALDLQHLVSRLGGEPATDETLSEWFHNAWTRVKLAFEPDKDLAVTSEMISEEQSMQQALAEALEVDELTSEARLLITTELEESRRTLESMGPLQAGFKAADDETI